MMRNLNFRIGDTEIGQGKPAYIIAEMSANHHQDFDKAKLIVKAAAESGADAIKVQTYTPELLTLDLKKPPFLIEGTIWSGKTLFELYKEAYMPWEWHEELKALSHSLGLDFFSTPTHKTGVDYLENLGVPVYKVPSFEIVDLDLLGYIASKGKPMILSAGMASLKEIDEAVTACRFAGCQELAILKCTSAYPAQPDEANLRTIPHISETFEVVAGLSDHTLGIEVPIGAVSLGASIVEKHLTLDRKSLGPDSSFSLEPHEFKKMVEGVRFIERALGEVSYGSTKGEASSRVFRRSLFAIKDIEQGEEFSPQNIASIRPGDGLHPRYYNTLLGKFAKQRIPNGSPLTWKLIL